MATSREIRTLEPDDQDALEAFLRPRVDSSIILLSNSRKAGLADRGQPFEGTYFAAFVDGRIAGVTAHYWLKNLIWQTPTEYVSALLEAVAAAALRPIEGLLGPRDQVTAAMAALRLSDDEIQLDEVEGLYSVRLDELAVPEILSTGKVRGRRIERRDVDQVAAWRVAYSVEALKADETEELREKCRADIESSCERGDTWVLEDGGRLVASTSFNAAIAEAVQVGGVWTPPQLRGRGYGRAVVARSLLDARADRVERAVLFTGDGNRPAVRAYHGLGFRRIGDYRLVLLKEAR